MNRVWDEIHEVHNAIDAEISRRRANPSQFTRERQEALDDLIDRAHELSAQLDAEAPRLVREIASDRILGRIFIRNLYPDESTKEGRSVARLKEIQRRMDQASSEQLPALNEEMTRLLDELRQEYERARAARRARVV